LDVYPIALGDANPQKKADWIEKHIKNGYTDIAFMDDSPANVRAIDALKLKYPDITLKTKLVVDNFAPKDKVRIFESVLRNNFKKILNKLH
jgi:hypothetical protein